MASTCEICGHGLSMVQRARGRKQCDSCAVEAKAALERALTEYDGALAAAIQAGSADGSPVARLRALEQTIAAGGGDTKARKASCYRSYLDHALADEILSAEEERLLNAVGERLYPSGEEADQRAVLAAYRAPLFIAMVNDGRLPHMTEARMMLKKGEILHLEEPAALLKEVIQREFQAGTRGVSFRVMKGVSYRVGSVRGKMVEVGRSLVAIDEGAICITSIRAVFTGERKTIEMPYAKMLDMNVYTDAIQIHLSSRQNPSMFRVASGPMVAAAINAATQKLL